MSSVVSAPPRALADAIRLMRSGDLAAALRTAEGALADASDRAPFLALASLAALRLGKAAEAVPHLRELTTLHPDDKASRNNFVTALAEAGEIDEALALAAGSKEPALARVEGHIHQQRGELDLAAAAYQRALDGDPNDLTSVNNLGNVLTSLERFDDAIHAFERAISLAPADVPIYLNLAETLRIADRPGPRVKVLMDALAIAPTNLRVLTDLGMAQAHNDEIDQAMETLRRAMALADGFSEAHIEYGMLLESLNRTDELADLVRSFKREDAPPEAAYLIAWDARRAGDFEEASRIAEVIPDSVNPMRRWQLVGGIADRMEDAAKAFLAFERMNAAALVDARAEVGPTYRERVETQLRNWTPSWAASWSDLAPSDDGLKDPVFLVGFPRSGTTLLDTMLMGLPELSVLEERPMMARVARSAADETLPTMTPARIAELRSTYFAAAREFGWDETRWLVDKHPLNMQRVPLIRRIFPNARIILAERHPYDVVLSCFMANFTLNHAMRSFTSLDEGARTYDAVWRAWSKGVELFPVDWQAVRYERLVDDPRAELEPLVEWLGLEWNPRLLEHTDIARERGQVRTASYSQIGEQLYTRARYRWRRYSEHLAPVMPILRPWAERLGYETA